MPDWDVGVPERYKAYRDRPVFDLLMRLPPLEPAQVWDLGCGDGEHAAMLAKRYPGAKVHGLDNAVAAIEKARRRPEPVDWVLGDIARFAPKEPVDLLFSSAALDLVADHTRLIPALAQTLAPGGVLAMQAPLTFNSLAHRILVDLAGEGPWAGARDALRSVPAHLSPVASYFDLLAPYCDEADIWTTTQVQLLSGAEPSLDWLMAAGLRPYIDRLPKGPWLSSFLETARKRLAEYYPRRHNGVTPVPVERLFILARRG